MKVKVRAGTSTRRRRWLLAPAAGAVATLAFAATSLAGTPNAWTRAHDMSTPRFGAAAALLPDGKVPVAGGEDSSSQPTSSAEIYDPGHDTWTAAPDMGDTLDSGEAAVLADGRVLVVGAADKNYPAGVFSELYDPTTESWAPVTGMQDAHRLGAIVPLSGGTLMVVGGIGDVAGSSKVDIFDPVANSFSAGTPLPQPRLAPAVAALPGGKVLVAGGIDPPSTVLDTALVYDPAHGWTPTANNLSVARTEAVTAPLPGGKVLIAGGASSSTEATAAADVYDPATNTFSPTASMSTERAIPGMTALADGRVVVAGGAATDAAGGQYVNATAEAYDPATGTWSPAGRMSDPRLGFPLVRLADDELLAVGGSAKAEWQTSPDPLPLLSADRYAPSIAPGAPAAVSASAGNRSALVTWAPPASDGGLPVLHYRVTAAPGGATVTTSDTRTAAIVPGLANGVSYTFTVRAVNARGASTASAPSNAVTPSAPAAPPTVTPPAGNARDTTAPKVKIAGLHSRMTPKGFLHGVHVRIRPSEPIRLDVSLVGYARQARVARAYNLTLARRHTRSSARTRELTLKPRKRLLGHAQRFRVQLRVVATDRAGNRRTTTKTIKVAPKHHHSKRTHHKNKHHR